MNNDITELMEMSVTELTDVIYKSIKSKDNLVKYIESKIKELQPQLNKSPKGLWLYHIQRGEMNAYKDMLERVKNGKYE